MREAVNKESEAELLKHKKLLQLNNIYYLWNYNSVFKNMLFSYKYKRRIKIAKLIARIIESDFFYVSEEKNRCSNKLCL